MADLNTFDDQIVVFEAVKASDTGRLPIRQPLQPTDSPILSPPRKQVIPHSMDDVRDSKPSRPTNRGPIPNSRDENLTTSPSSRPPRVSGPGMSYRSDTLSPAVPDQGHGMLAPSAPPPPATTKSRQSYQPYQPSPSLQYMDNSRLAVHHTQQTPSVDEQAALVQRQHTHLAQRVQSGTPQPSDRGTNSILRDTPAPDSTSSFVSDAAERSGCKQYCQAWRERYNRAYPACSRGTMKISF